MKLIDSSMVELSTELIKRFNGHRGELSTGMKDTPARYIKFFKEQITQTEVNYTTFDAEGMDEMICQTQIQFYSLCEHHLVPFFGVAHVAYIPNGKIVGLSKLARCVEYYAKGFQNQERITSNVANKLNDELDAIGVGVILQAEHLCMAMRGVKKAGAITTTSKMLGSFRRDEACRNEFLQLVNMK